MKLLMYGVNRETVSSEDIHKYSLNQTAYRMHLNDIYQFDGVSEVVLLVTENRNEYYLYVDEASFKHGDLLRYLSDYTEKPLEEIILETYSKFNDDVVKHLLNVSSYVEVSEAHTFESIDIIDHALMKSIEEKTVGTILYTLFKKSVEFSLSLCEKEEIKPLLQGDVSKAVRSIKETIKETDSSHYLIIGNDKFTNQVMKYFVGSQYSSMAVVNRGHDSQNTVNELRRWLRLTKQSSWIKNIHEISSSQLLYRLAKSDVVIIGPDEKNSWFTEELFDEMRCLRPSPKKQLVYDFSLTQDETVLQKFDLIHYKHISDEPKRLYTDEKIEEAKTTYDEMVSLQTEQYIKQFNKLQECLPIRIENEFVSEGNISFTKKISYKV
ncbi:MAG: hypothetical protein JJU01_00945 [Alkalibacterium sp.]|nr:hypothetical protein [Alkalibacterium sp.]TVP92559.1 MAG: hypothetical protein EA249_03285 [Alkalibacterium sp.]